ncbi:MAG: RNA polymerase sigma factor [bacterium]
MGDVRSDSDAELMKKVAQEDLIAFSELLKRYQSPLFNFNYRYLGNYDEAQDLTQEVFLRIYTSAKKYKPLAKFTTYLFKIARNLCLNKLKKRRFWLFSLDEPEKSAEIPASDSTRPDVICEKEETIASVRKALSSLGENQRTAVILQRFYNLSYEEIAEVMECSVSAVESLLFRAKQNLKKRLSFQNSVTKEKGINY